MLRRYFWERSDYNDSFISLHTLARLHDDDHGATERRVCIHIFPETNEADVKTSEFVQHFEEMFHRTSHAVERPNHHNIEPTAPGISHKLIQTGALGFRSANRVGVLSDNLYPRAFAKGRRSQSCVSVC
jgi:hypothetical protein